MNFLRYARALIDRELFSFHQRFLPRFAPLFFWGFSVTQRDVSWGRTFHSKCHTSNSISLASHGQQLLIIRLITSNRSLDNADGRFSTRRRKVRLFCLARRAIERKRLLDVPYAPIFSRLAVLLEMRYISLRYNNCYSVSAKCNLFTKYLFFLLFFTCCCCRSIQ